MSNLTCAEAEELAAELALGTLPGDQRSSLLSHIDGCGDCRKLVKELSDTADALLLTAPEIDPPAGFAKRVTAGLQPPRRRRWRSVAAAVAVALVVGLVAGYVPGHLGAGSAARVSVASFVPMGGEALAGRVWARSDNPGWVFMTVHDDGSGESYTCELVLRNGQHVWIGSFQMQGGQGSWGHSVAVTVDQVRSVQLSDAQGKLAATATLG